MGKIRSILPVSEMVANTVDTYIKDATENYPSFLNNAPILVTVYSRQHYKSTHDVSFENFNEVVGDESPNKFNKIENVPVYNLDTSDFGTDATDFGLKGNVTSSCVILPNTVSLKAEDLIEISIHSTKYLFSVTTSSPDNFGNTKFYKVSFMLSQYTKDEANRLVDKELELDYNLIGTKSNVIHTKTHVAAMEIIRSQYDDILATYVDIFYNRASQTFVNPIASSLDQYLNYFILKNNLHVPFLSFRNSNNINPSIDRYLSKAKYAHTFLKNVSDLNFDKAALNTLNRAYGTAVTGYYTFNYFLNKKIQFVEYYSGNTGEEIEVFNFDIFSDSTVISEDFPDVNLKFIAYFGKLLNDEIVLTDEQGVETKYSSKTEFIDEVLIPLLDNLEVRYSPIVSEHSITLSDYYHTPVLLFTLKSLFEILRNS